jgi:hypothetical protein
VNEFSNWDRAKAQARADAAKRNLKKARNSGNPEAIAEHGDRAKAANRLLRRTKRSGPGPDASRQGPPGPQDT